MNTVDLEAIVKFLNIQKDLISFFKKEFFHINNPEGMLWNTKEGYSVSFPFCRNTEEISFWKNISNEYDHIYPYVLLCEILRTTEDDDNIDIRNTLIEFEDNEILSQQVVALKNNLFTILNPPSSIIPQLAFSIDSFLWKKERKSPFFPQEIRKNHPEINLDLSYYCNLLRKSIEHDSVNVVLHIADYLNYCQATDLVVGDVKCLCIYLSFLFPEFKGDTKKIHSIINKITMKWDKAHFYLYVFEVLQYFDSISSKNESNSSISINFLEAVSSEIVKEQTKLSEVEQQKYIIPLSILKARSLNKGVTEQSNNVDKHEWKIIAKLYSNDIYVGEEFLQGYSPENYWTRLPFTRKTSLSWSFYKSKQDKVINLRIKFFKILTSINEALPTNPILIGSYTWSVNVKKNFWEKLNYSGEPCLSITVKIEFRVSENEDFIVDNISWNCDKIWPSIDSEYTYGDSDPLSQTNYIP